MRPPLRDLVQRGLFAASLPPALIALASLTAPWSWLGDLCLHLSWQAALALLPALLAAGRHRGRAGFLMLAMLVGLWPAVRGSYEPRAPLPAQGGADLVLASANLFDFNQQRARALERIMALDCDLLALQEVLHGDQDVLSTRWPHVVWNHGRELLGSALFSRHPILWSHVHDLDSFALVEALVRTPLGTLRVFVVHLASPKRPERAASRTWQLERLACLVRASTGPVVIAGDFNLCSASPRWRRLVADAGVLRPAGLGPASWPTWLGPLAIDLDHVAGRGVAFAPLQSFAIPGSDHRGLITRLSVP